MNKEGAPSFDAVDFLDPHSADIRHRIAVGSFSVLAVVVSGSPDQKHAREIDAASFHIVDHTEGTDVHVHDAGGRGLGVMRPWANWFVSLLPSDKPHPMNNSVP